MQLVTSFFHDVTNFVFLLVILYNPCLFDGFFLVYIFISLITLFKEVEQSRKPNTAASQVGKQTLILNLIMVVSLQHCCIKNSQFFSCSTCVTSSPVMYFNTSSSIFSDINVTRGRPGVSLAKLIIIQCEMLRQKRDFTNVRPVFEFQKVVTVMHNYVKLREVQ